LDVSPCGEVAYIVAVWSVLWSRPIECPASCVTVFWMSMRTQPVWLGAVQTGLSTAVKMNLVPLSAGESLSSMSLSLIWPVLRFEVVVVVAMTPSPLSQQSYLLPQPPWERQESLAGTTPAAWQFLMRNRTRLRLTWPGK